MAETTKIYVNSSWTESTVFEGDYAGLEWGKTAFADFATATAAASAGAEIIAVGDVTGADSVRLTGGAYSITGQDGASIYMDGNLHLQYESSDKKSLKDYSDFAPLTLTINTDLSANYLQVGPLNDTDELDCEADQVSGILESLRKNTAAVIVDGADVDARAAINIYSYATAEFKNGAHLDAGNLCVRGEATFTGSTFNVGDQGQSLSVYMKPEFYTEGYSAAELTLNNSIGEANYVGVGTADRAGVINLTNGSKLTATDGAVTVNAAGTLKIDTNSTLVYTKGISLTNGTETDKAIQITADLSAADSGVLVWVDGTASASVASIKDYVTINATNGDGWTVADGSNGSVYAYNAEKMTGAYVSSNAVTKGALAAGANGYYIGGVNTYASFADALAAGKTVIEFNDYTTGGNMNIEGGNYTLSGTLTENGELGIFATKSASLTIAKDTSFEITGDYGSSIVFGAGWLGADGLATMQVDGTLKVTKGAFNVQPFGTVNVSATGKLDLSEASAGGYDMFNGNINITGDGTFEEASMVVRCMYFFKDNSYTSADDAAVDYNNLTVKDALIQSTGATNLGFTSGVIAYNESQIIDLKISLDNSIWSAGGHVNVGSDVVVSGEGLAVKDESSNAYINLANGSEMDVTKGNIYVGADQTFNYLVAPDAEAGSAGTFTTESVITIDATSTLKYAEGLYIYANNAAVAGSEGAEGVAYKGGSIVINADAAKIADQDVVFWIDGRGSETGAKVLLTDGTDITATDLNNAIEFNGKDALTEAGWQIVNDGKSVFAYNTNNIDMSTITVNADWAGKYSLGDTIEGYDGVYFGINAFSDKKDIQVRNATSNTQQILRGEHVVFTGDFNYQNQIGNPDIASGSHLYFYGTADAPQTITLDAANIDFYSPSNGGNQIIIGSDYVISGTTLTKEGYAATLELKNGSSMTVGYSGLAANGTITIDATSSFYQKSGMSNGFYLGCTSVRSKGDENYDGGKIIINANMDDLEAAGKAFHTWLTIENRTALYYKDKSAFYEQEALSDAIELNVSNNEKLEDGSDRWVITKSVVGATASVFAYDAGQVSVTNLYVNTDAWTEKTTEDGVFKDPTTGDVNLLKGVNAFDTVRSAVDFAKSTGSEIQFYDGTSYKVLGTDIQMDKYLLTTSALTEEQTAAGYVAGANALSTFGEAIATAGYYGGDVITIVGADSAAYTSDYLNLSGAKTYNLGTETETVIVKTGTNSTTTNLTSTVAAESTLNINEGSKLIINTHNGTQGPVFNGTVNVDGTIEAVGGGDFSKLQIGKEMNISSTGRVNLTTAYYLRFGKGGTITATGNGEDYVAVANDASTYQLSFSGGDYSLMRNESIATINIQDYAAAWFRMAEDLTSTASAVMNLNLDNGKLDAAKLNSGNGTAIISMTGDSQLNVNSLSLNEKSSLTMAYGTSIVTYKESITVAEGGSFAIDMTGADSSEAFIKVVDATNNKGKFTGVVTVTGQAQAPVATFSAENVADGDGLVAADKVYDVYVQTATGDVFVYAKTGLDLYELYSLNKTETVAGYTLSGAIDAVNVYATNAVTVDAGAVITYSGEWQATEGVNITVTGTLEKPHKLIDYTGTEDAPAAYDNVIADAAAGFETQIIGGDLYLVAKSEGGEPGPELKTDKTTIVANGLRGDEDPVLYNGEYWVKDFNMFNSLSSALNGADDTTTEFVLTNLAFTESALKDLTAATEGKTLTVDGCVTVTGYTKINEWSALLDGADLKGTAGNDTLAISAKGTKMKVDGAQMIWGDGLEAGVSAELNYGDMSIDLRGGNNKVTVGSGSVLSLKDLKNVSSVTVSKDKAEKVGKETLTADTALNLAEDLVTSEGTVAVNIQDGAEMTAASITKADAGMGVNNITLGKASTLTLTGTGAGMEYVQNLTLGDNAVVSGAEKVLTGTDTANTVVKTGVGASLTLGTMNLGEGKNSITTGNNSVLDVDSMADVTTLKIGSGTFDKKTGVQNIAKADIDSLAMSAGVTEITLGSFAEMNVNTITNGNNGSKITVGANSYLGIAEQSGVTITDLSLTAGSNKTGSDITVMNAADTAIVGTVAKNSIKTGNNADLTLGAIDLKGGKNSIELGGKNVDFASGEIKNVQTFKIGAGKAEKDGSYLAENYTRAEIGGNFTGVAGANTIDLGAGADVEISGSILESALGGSYAVKLGADAALTVQEIEALSSLNLGADAELHATDISGADDGIKTAVTVGKNAVLDVDSISGVKTLTLNAGATAVGIETVSFGAAASGNKLDVQAGANFGAAEITGTANAEAVAVAKNATLTGETLALGEGKNSVTLSGAGAMMDVNEISGVNTLDVKAGALLKSGSLSGTALANDKMTVSGDLYLTDLDIAGIENFTLNKGGKIFASEDVLGALSELDIFTDKGGQLIEFDGIGDDLVDGEGWLRGGVDDKDTVKLSDAKELTVNGNFADVLSVSSDNGVIEGTYDKKTKITTWKLEGLTSVSVEFADVAQDKKGYVMYTIA